MQLQTVEEIFAKTREHLYLKNNESIFSKDYVDLICTASLSLKKNQLKTRIINNF